MKKTDKEEQTGACNALSEARKLAENDGYTLKDDVIQDLGKFEGEHVMTLYFYDAMMNGDGEAYGEENDLKFNISDDEAEAFDIAKGAQVILCFSDNGFVTSYINYDGDENEEGEYFIYRVN